MIYERLDSTQKQLSYRTSSMTMCTVEKAYENGWLTQTDLAYAMFYATGRVYTCTKSDWEKYQWEAAEEIDFTPEDECPALDSKVERDIKRHEYEGYHYKDNLTYDEFEHNFSLRFVGSYNGTFIIRDIQTIYWDYPKVKNKEIMVLCLLFLISLLCGLGTMLRSRITAFTTEGQEKIICNATIDDKFEEVKFNQKAIEYCGGNGYGLVSALLV